MAGIDKIYGNLRQYRELLAWLEKNNPDAVKYLRHDILECKAEDILDCDDYPISNFPKRIDIWLWNNCPLQFVKDAIEYQYNGEPVEK